MSLTVAFCIPTHNRLADLRRALDALTKLHPPADEILIAADGCTDGTVEWLRENHPGITLVVHEQSRGSIPSRNAVFRMVKSDVIVSIDDDSYPIETDAVSTLRTLFENNLQLGAVDLPQVTDERPETLQRTLGDFGLAHFCGTFVGAAAAFRSRLVPELGGYTDLFFHMYEEPDFAVRIHAAGWQVRFEPVLRVRHHWSGTGRSEIRNHHRHARNEFWSALIRCPLPWLPLIAAFRAFRQFTYAVKRGWALREPAWWADAIRGIPACLRQRRPLPWRAYRGWMDLIRRPHNDAAKWTATFGK